jgi:hypothetical protein
MENNLEARLLAVWNQRRPHKSIFAIISIVTPLAGLLTAICFVLFFQPVPHAHEFQYDIGFGAFGTFVSILFLSCVAGAIFGVIALIRRENQKAVFSGLLLNCCPLLLLPLFCR